MERAIAKDTIYFRVFFDSDLLSDDNMTKAESQNTGMDIIYPIILNAIVGLFSVTNRMIACEIVDVAPDFSKITPINVPAIMIMPILFSISPNPVVMMPPILLSGIPAKKAIKKVAISKAKKG